MNEQLFRNVLKTIKQNPDLSNDIIDSFSDNQYKSKKKLLSFVDWILSKNAEVAIFGAWYGSILIPAIAPRVERVTALDLNSRVLRIAKNNLFAEYKNVEYITGDVFEKDLKRFHNTNLFINTSCEHMPPMKDWPFWSRFDTHFAFQSNNMDYIEDHTNCVFSLEEFKSQMPENATVLFEDEIQDTRGTRYMLVGKVQRTI